MSAVCPQLHCTFPMNPILIFPKLLKKDLKCYSTDIFKNILSQKIYSWLFNAKFENRHFFKNRPRVHVYFGMIQSNFKHGIFIHLCHKAVATPVIHINAYTHKYKDAKMNKASAYIFFIYFNCCLEINTTTLPRCLWSCSSCTSIIISALCFWKDILCAALSWLNISAAAIQMTLKLFVSKTKFFRQKQNVTLQ